MVIYDKTHKTLIIPSGLDGEGGSGRIPVLESLEVTGNGVYVPEEGVDGFNRVEVNVPASSAEDNYLYELDYSELDYEYANEYFEQRAPEFTPGGCSAICKGSWVGRNLDWRYDNELSFIVRTPHADGLYATLGVAGGMPSITKSHYENEGLTEEEALVLPFYLQDGINEHGLFAEMNVVPTAGNTQTEGDARFCALMAVRYILDHYKSVSEVLSDLDNLQMFFPQSLLDMEYEIHFLLADPEEAKVLEVIDNEWQVIDHQQLTNFHLYGVNFDDQNKVYTPWTAQEEEHYAHADQNVELYGSGLERWNILQDAQIFDKESLLEVMQSLYFSKAYEGDMDVAWNSEFVGGNITVDTPVGTRDFVQRVREYRKKWQDRSRETGEVWITTHSSLYNLDTLELTLYSQETGGERRSILLQRIPILETLLATNNGVYTPSEGTDGFSNVIVNVPSSEPVLEPLTVTEDGFYEPAPGTDGFNQVTVDVAPEVDLQPLTITENGHYYPIPGSDGISDVTVNVPNVPTGGGNVILYQTIDNQPLTFTYGKYVFWNDEGTLKPCTLLSNTMNNGMGMLVYDHDIARLDDNFFDEGQIGKVLLSVILPSTMTDFGDYIFDGQTKLAYASLPSSLDQIDKYSFDNCEDLKSVIIPEGVTRLASKAFRNSGLTEITIPNSVTSYGDQTFYNCNDLEKVHYGNGGGEGISHESSGSVFYGCKIKKLTLEPGLIRIENNLFQNQKLEKVTIPSSVTLIGSYAFRGSPNLLNIRVEATTPPSFYSFVGQYAPFDILEGMSITVPPGTLNTYKTNQYWSQYADYITEYTE